MKIALLSLLFLALAPTAPAQHDPLKSAACGAALASLQAARSSGAPAAAVEDLRSAAAGSCLGSTVVPGRPSRVLQTPVVVPPPQIQAAPRPVPPFAPVLPPPPVAIERAPLPATCDAGGCWTNDGTHLRHVPPSLAGPRGLCIQQGGQLACP